MSASSMSVDSPKHNDHALIKELSENLERTSLISTISDQQIGYLNEISQKTPSSSTTICLDSTRVSSETIDALLQFRSDNRSLISKIQKYRRHYPLSHKSEMQQRPDRTKSLLYFLTVRNPLRKEPVIEPNDPEIGSSLMSRRELLGQAFNQIVRSYPEERLERFVALTSKYKLTHRESHLLKSHLIEHEDNEQLLYQNRAQTLNLCGHHSGSFLNDPSSAIVQEYGSPHDRSNLNHSENPLNSNFVPDSGIAAREHEITDYKRLQYNSKTKTWEIPLTPEEKLEVDKFCKYLLDAEDGDRFQLYTILLSKNHHLTVPQNEKIKELLFEYLDYDILELKDTQTKRSRELDYSIINYNEEMESIEFGGEEFQWNPDFETWKSHLLTHLENQPSIDAIDPQSGLRLNLLNFLYKFNVQNFRNKDGNRDLHTQAQAYTISILVCQLTEEEALTLQENLETTQAERSKATAAAYQKRIDKIEKTKTLISLVKYNRREHAWYISKEMIPHIHSDSSPELSRTKNPETDPSEESPARNSGSPGMATPSSSSSSEDDLIIPAYSKLPTDSPLRKKTDEFLGSYTGRLTSSLGIELLRKSDMNEREIVDKLHQLP